MAEKPQKGTTYIKQRVSENISEDGFYMQETSALAFMKKALADGCGFDFVQEERPAPSFYRTLLTCNDESRKDYLNRQKPSLSKYQRADYDIRKLLKLKDGENYGCKQLDPKFIGNLNSKKRSQRREAELELCLHIQPPLNTAQANAVLTKFLGSTSLHMRSAIDAVYAFIFKSRDAGCDTTEKWIAEMKEILGLIEPHSSQKKEALMSTQMISDSFDNICPGDADAFRKWFVDNQAHFDAADHYYQARRLFRKNLYLVAASDYASRWSFKQSESDETYYPLKQEYFNRLKDRTGSIDYVEAYKSRSELSAVGIITGNIGADFYTLWLIIGIRFMLKYRGNMPEGFPEQKSKRWLDYYRYLTDDGKITQEKQIISRIQEELDDYHELNDGKKAMQERQFIYIQDEPAYLIALRTYLGSKEVSKSDPFKKLYKQVEESRDHLREIMDDHSILQYIVSDWHYECIEGKITPKSGLPENDSRWSDECSERLSHLSSDAKHIVSPKRKDFVDPPRSLLILSELTRMVLPDNEEYWLTGRNLEQYINMKLTECGYPQLDVRRKFDFLLYCALVMDNQGKVALERTLDALEESISNYVFTDPCKQILKFDDFEPITHMPDEIER